jgi:intracellular multiplication protein IcmJ
MQYPLQLNIDPEGWQLFNMRKADPAFRKFQDKVFKRDEYICQFCTFQGKQYFEIVNLDNNYNNNKLSNMISACCICTQCLFIDNAGRDDYGGGTLIYLPQITQSKLNSLSHVLFCVITNNTGYKMSAKTIFRNLKFGAKAIEKKFGEGTSEPATFAKLLIESDIDLQKVRDTILKDIRLLPSKTGFATQIREWAEAAIDTLEEESKPHNSKYTEKNAQEISELKDEIR